jgi:hypothetical protein
MDILPPEFSDEQVGLEAPPSGLPDTAAGDDMATVIVITLCPGCGSKEPAVPQDEREGTMMCPQCQCGYSPQSGTNPEMALESSAKHALSYLQSRRVPLNFKRNGKNAS